MRIEIWRTIEGFNGKYQISTLGRVRSIRTHKKKKIGYRYLSILKDKYGSLYCSLHGGTRSISRLVAKAFIENPENFNHVAYKDGDRTNVFVNNLYWHSNPKGTITDVQKKKAEREAWEKQKEIERIKRLKEEDKTTGAWMNSNERKYIKQLKHFTGWNT